MDTSVQVSDYDNQISLLYKVGQYFQLPTKYILVRPATHSDQPSDQTLILQDLVYQSIVYLISIEQGPIDEIYKKLIGQDNPITRKEFGFIFYSEQGDAVFNQIQEFLDNEKFKDIRAFKYAYDEWVKAIQKSLDEDRLKLDKIIGIQESLEQIPPEYIKQPTEIAVSRITLRAYPSLNSGLKPSVDDGLDIFNAIQLSYFIPYIYYNRGENGKRYHKIYRGETTTTDVISPGAEPNLSMIIPAKKNKATEQKDIIYATVWIGSDNQVINKPIRESYTGLIYDLNTGEMNFKTKISENNQGMKEKIIERISQAFSNLKIGEVKEMKISGEFDIPLGEGIKDYVFLHMVLNDASFNNYLYADERDKPYPEKKRVTIHFKSLIGQSEDEEGNTSPATVSAMINNKVDNEGKGYVKVNITQADSKDIANQFRGILTILLGLYLQTKDDIIEFYDQYITSPAPQPFKRKIVLKKSGTKEGGVKSNSALLKEAAPHIFIAEWARRCQNIYQPIPIQEDQIEEWENRTIINPDTGEREKRQVMRFPPPPKDEVILVCPSDSKPYPGVRKSLLENSEQYPYIACCYASDQTAPGLDTPYNIYYKGAKAKEDKKTKRRLNIITEKIVPPGGKGEITVTLENILLKYSDKPSKFKRYGVVRDPNSFIHCVLEALNYEDYTSQSVEDKTFLVLQIREKLASDINPSVMKQELYDFNDDEIVNQVLALDLFFDPALYYRAIEEFFNINIYTFTPGKRPKEDRQESFGKIEVPRHKVFHSRPIRPDRQTVLIYKHRGAEADVLEYPQCELIVDIPEDRGIPIKVFDESMTNLVHDILMSTFPTTTYSYDQETKLLQSYNNLYSRINFDQLTDRQAIGQIIDDYGKLRGLLFNDISIYFLPSQPENIPATKEVKRVNHQQATRKFGEPNAIVRSQDGQSVVGLWFPHQDFPEYPYVIFVPINPTQEYSDLPNGPQAPLESKETQTSARVLLLQRQIKLITQVIKYLFSLSQPITADEFMNRYTTTNLQPVTDSSTFYDLTRLPRKLPDAENVQSAIQVLTPMAPTLFSKGKIVLYSKVFADKIADYLQDLKVFKTNKYIDDYFIYEKDFTPQPRTVILIGEDSFNNWLASLNLSGYKGINVTKTIDISFKVRKEPYLYLDTSTGIVYMVQNVNDGDLNKALNVGLSWLTQLDNPGYNTEPYPNPQQLPYRIYEISPSLNIQIKDEFIDPDTPEGDIINLLTYDNKDYAALLPIGQEEVENRFIDLVGDEEVEN